jgi:hypothetical protein
LVGGVVGGDVLSPSTALYILFDACCECFCTSLMHSASRASGLHLQVWGGADPRHASGGPVRFVRSLFRPTRSHKNKLGQVPQSLHSPPGAGRMLGRPDAGAGAGLEPASEPGLLPAAGRAAPEHCCRGGHSSAAIGCRPLHFRVFFTAVSWRLGSRRPHTI